MADRYSRLYHSDEAVYFGSSPVIIEAKALLCDNEADKNIAQVKFKNISPKTVTAVFADITAYDPSGETVEKISHTYLDLSAGRGDSFGAKNPAGLGGKTARSFDVTVCKAVFADGSVWENNDCERVVIPGQKDLTEYLGNASLSEQYQRRHGNCAKYVPQKISGIWQCACGKINLSDEGECFSCKQSLAALTESLDTEVLTAGLYDHAKGLMAKAVSEGDFKEAEGKFTSIKAYLDCADLAAECREKAECARKDRMYASAVKLMENNTVKSLEEAADSFKRISDWKDSAEMIGQCKNKLDEIKNKQAAVRAEQMKAEEKKKRIIAAVCGAAALCVVFAVVNENLKQAAAAKAERERIEQERREEEERIEKRHQKALSILSLLEENRGSCKNFNYLSSGERHTVGLKNDGTVTGVGSNDGGVLDISDWNDIVSVIATGHYDKNEFYITYGFTYGLKSDGTGIFSGDIVRWSDITNIDAGKDYFVGLKTDGTVVTFGLDREYQKIISDWSDIVDVAAQESFFEAIVGLKSDGSVVVAGCKGKSPYEDYKFEKRKIG